MAGRAQIAVPAAVTMGLGCMAARGSRLTPFARYGQLINEGIISSLFLGFSVLIPLEVGVRTMGVGVIRQPREVRPTGSSRLRHHCPYPACIRQQCCTGKGIHANDRDDPGAQPWYRDPPWTMTRGTCGP